MLVRFGWGENYVLQGHFRRRDAMVKKKSVQTKFANFPTLANASSKTRLE